MLSHCNHPVRFAGFLLSLLLFAGFLTACTWVKSTPQADKVRVVPADRVADCQRIGELSTYTKARIANVNRKAEKVRQELETLGRIEAAEMGADTITTSSEIVDGRMNFIAFRCQG